MTNALIVVDMVNGFCVPGGNLYTGESARRIIPNVYALCEDARNRGDVIIFVCDNHAPDDLEFKMFPEHCITGTKESEIISELEEFIPYGIVLPKQRYSGFYNTRLATILTEHFIKNVTVAGVCTNICVMHTVSDARNRDYPVTVYEEAVASFDEDIHTQALDHMDSILGADVRRIPKSTMRKKWELPRNIREGNTTDIYFKRSQEILDYVGENPRVVFDFFSNGAGILHGMDEALTLISQIDPDAQVRALQDGAHIGRKEVVMEVETNYQPFGLYETPLLGILSHSTGWATAAKELVDAAGMIPVTCFGARHVHPLIAGRMENAAVAAGMKGCASIEGAELAGINPTGTMPHALILAMGDTLRAAEAFDECQPAAVTRTVLVDTFKDEAEETLRIARVMGSRLHSVRLDTPSERGRVTPEMVKEIRARLDLEGYTHVGIIVSGGLDPERIQYFRAQNAPVSGFGVGGHIANAAPIHFTADIREVNGKAVAKRGRIPGRQGTSRLKHVDWSLFRWIN